MLYKEISPYSFYKQILAWKHTKNQPTNQPTKQKKSQTKNMVLKQA